MNKSKRRGRIQYAALPFQAADDGQPRVLLLTSRSTRRWVIPKGWPMPGRKPREVAAREAFEEAGLVGAVVGKRPIGRYSYQKQLSPRRSVVCEVSVYLFRVERQSDEWPEKAERETQWFEPSAAADLVNEDGLATLLRRALAAETAS